MSSLFRIQLGFPDFDLTSFSPIIGNWLTPQGKIDPEVYLALITMHGTIMVFFVLTAGLSGTFSNYLIPLQIGARDMASGFLNMLSYWFFFLSSIVMFISIFGTSANLGRTLSINVSGYIIFPGSVPKSLAKYVPSTTWERSPW